MKSIRQIFVLCAVLLFTFQSYSQIRVFQNDPTTAPGGPGTVGNWSRPDKEGFLATTSENVWATIADGILTEIYYPTIDRAQSRDTQILLISGINRLEERKDFTHKVLRYPKSLAYHVSSYNQNTNIRIEKDIVLDPTRTALIVNYDISLGSQVPTTIYLMHNPAADNTTGGDSVYISNPPGAPGEMMAFQSDRRGDEPVILSKRANQLLVLDRPASTGTAGFEGVNGPWEQIMGRGNLITPYKSAINGNVAGALSLGTYHDHLQFRFAISFNLDNQISTNALRQIANESLKTPLNTLLSKQQTEWSNYLGTLNSIGQKLEPHVLVIKGLEDKIFRGALIAGPTLPALPNYIEAVEWDYETARLRKGDVNGGYHRVWPRDATQMALGLLAAGDTFTPMSVAKYLARIQNPDGTFPQNTWVDGQTSWTGYQLDQSGFPILLVSRLVELGLVGYPEFQSMVIKAAESMVRRGPLTDMDRWEENKGISPNSLAIACQGLLEAAWLEKENPQRSQTYVSTCQSWRENLYYWTFVTSGSLGQNYFERMEVAGDPNHMAPITIHNDPVGGSVFPENAIIDGGFIQWIISGLIPALDPHFTTSLQIYDRAARGPAPGGLGYLRYNHDGYGVGHQGRPWPLLSGERALASLVRGEDPSEHTRVMLSSVSPAGMLAEQTNVSASPLGWAHAEVLILARSLADNKSFYIPRHVNAYFK